MPAVKEKICITISADLADLLNEMAETYDIPKSQIVEKSLRQMVDERMEADSKKMAELVAKDLPTSDEWLSIHPKLPSW